MEHLTTLMSDITFQSTSTAIVLYLLETHVVELTLHHRTSLLEGLLFFAAFSSEELSADNDFLFLLVLPACNQGVYVTAVVTRPVSSGTRNKPCRTCTVQCCGALPRVHQHANRTFKPLPKAVHDYVTVGVVLQVLQLDQVDAVS